MLRQTLLTFLKRESAEEDKFGSRQSVNGCKMM